MLGVSSSGDRHREVIMSTMVHNRRSSFGTSCAQCGNELIAPEWSEYRSEHQVICGIVGNATIVLRLSSTQSRWQPAL
jgi:hypothetical protein